MKSRMRGALALVALLAGGTMTAEAQGPMTFGPRVLVDLHWEALGLGAHLTKPVTDAISAYPSFEILFGDGYSVMRLNADLLYKVPLPNMELMELSVGSGLVLSRWSIDGCDDLPGGFGDSCDSTDVGVNLIGSIQLAGPGRIKPFGEARLIVAGDAGFVLVAGLKIPLGN